MSQRGRRRHDHWRYAGAPPGYRGAVCAKLASDSKVRHRRRYFGAQYPVGRPGNQAVTLMKHYASRSGLVDRAIGSVGLIMRIWLEYDPVALAVLVFGIAAIEFLAFNI